MVWPRMASEVSITKSLHAMRIGLTMSKVSKDLVKYIDLTVRQNKKNGMGNFLLEDPVWAEEFAPNGTIVEVGQLMTRPRYARYV